MSLDLNPQFIRAYELMEQTEKHLFITGKAGTGKSTLLDYFRKQTKKNCAVLAPTGVAAVNVRGQTIHSFFGFKPDITPDLIQKPSSRNGQLYKHLDCIIIDEISMVRADLLDCIDKFLRLNGRDKYAPFGGVQIIMIGDLYQLPPVVTLQDRELLSRRYRSPYFFDADVFACLRLELVELEIIYRQQDETFIDVLNAIRTNTTTVDHFSRLNSQHQPLGEATDGAITLTTTNALADGVNSDRLAQIAGAPITYEGQSSGNFLEKDAPAPRQLTLKIGAQVMLLNNDSGKRWVNGSIGTITEIKSEIGEPDTIVVMLQDGRHVDVLPYSWESSEFVLDDRSKVVTAKATGTFTQYPLKLAWAVTIHKSQGKTFDQVVIDLGRGTFAHGQLYVALSRCTTLEGIVLKQLVTRRHIVMDQRVVAFMQQFKETSVFRGEDAYEPAPQLF
ncbi:MAG TPA: AAA family ATPase [Patescibacteria group bacterium]